MPLHVNTDKQVKGEIGSKSTECWRCHEIDKQARERERGRKCESEQECHSSLNEKQCVMPTLTLTSYSSASWWLTPFLHTPPFFFSSLPASCIQLLFCVISPSICQFCFTPPVFPWGFSLKQGDWGGMTMFWFPHTHTAERQSINTLRGCWWWLRPFTWW